MQKNIPTLIGIIIIIVATAVAFVGILVLEKTPIPSVVKVGNTVLQNTQTAGWKTYTNTKYGFEIKYPSDWSDSQSLEGVAVLTDKSGNWRIEIKNIFDHYVLPQNLSFNDYVDRISKYINTANDTAIFESSKVSGFNKEDAIVSGLKSVKFSYLYNKNIYYISEIIPYQKSALEIDYISSLDSGLDVNKDKLLFENILSTFKFTK